MARCRLAGVCGKGVGNMINLKELKQRLAELEEMKFGPGLDDFGSAHQLELIGWCRDLIEEVERLRKLPNIGRELSNLEPDNKVLHLKNKENAAGSGGSMRRNA